MTSQSTSSESDSTKPAKKARKVETLLTRTSRVRPIGEADMRWLWAAYKSGSYKEVLPGNMDTAAFTDTVLDVIDSSDVGYMVDAPGDDGLRPVGIVLGTVFGKGRCMEPHVDWFPWATPRNKMEASATFLRQIKRQYKVFLFIDDKNLAFWDRMAKYRLMTRGCKVIDHYGPGEHAMMFYTVGM